MSWWPRVRAAQEMPADAERVLELARAKGLSLPRAIFLATPARKPSSANTFAGESRSRDKDSCGGPLKLDLMRSASDRIRWKWRSRKGTRSTHGPAPASSIADVNELVTSGPISTGSFGTILIGMFDNPGASIKFAGANR